MIQSVYNTNKNKSMIDALHKKTYNYYRRADIKKIALESKKLRLMKLSDFN